MPNWFVLSWPQGRKRANELVDSELWIKVDDGWRFHDWDHYQVTREEIERGRALNRKRQKEWRERTRKKREASLGESQT